MKKKSNFKLSFDKEKKEKPRTTPCAVAGCAEAGEYKAPKSPRDLNDYQWFCLEHIRQFNKAWDYFKGLSEDEIIDFQKDATHGHRPTWRFGMNAAEQEEMLRNIFENFFYISNVNKGKPMRPISGKERKALDVMGFDAPVGIKELKARHKELVKKHHPDLNNSNPHAEEKFKRVQEAYDYLKQKYQ